MITFATVRALGRRLPNVEADTAYSSPALKVNGRILACMATNKSAEPNSLIVKLPDAERDELLAGDPAVYYVTDHYVDYACVLVRLSRVNRDALADLLLMAHRFMSNRPKKRLRKSRT